MFDHVGRNRNQSAARTAGSLLFSLVLNGSGLAILFYATMKAPEMLEDAKAALVAVNLAAPPPPPPPPPPPGGKKKPHKEKEVVQDTPPDPTVLQEAPPPVEEEPEDDGGQEGGVEGGVKDGVVGGVVGGVKDGVLDGQLGGTGVVKSVYWTEVQIKSKVVPEFPEAARQLGLKNERCIVHLVIDEQGVPIDFQFKTCPELFKSAAKDAAMQWRFYPLIDNGAPVKAGFDLNFQFKLK